ncbi:hypothetical protein VP758_001584 [Vibrio harveyi]|nr:hypothetical protein [Vibrio harveyi]
MKNIHVLPKPAQAIERFDVCLFDKPITINGVTYTGATRTREAKVRDRINAERWCNEVLGFKTGDGVIAGIASVVMEFGTIEGNTELDENGALIGPLKLTNRQALAADTIIDSFAYDEFTWLARLLGKEMPSPESKSQILENSSNTLPTEKSE